MHLLTFLEISYKAKAIVDEDVSKPAATKTAACAKITSSVKTAKLLKNLHEYSKDYFP